MRFGMGTAVLIFEKSCRTGAWLVRRPNPVLVVSSRFADMNIPYLRSLARPSCNENSLRRQLYVAKTRLSGQGAQCPNRFVVKSDSAKSSLLGSNASASILPKFNRLTAHSQADKNC